MIDLALFLGLLYTELSDLGPENIGASSRVADWVIPLREAVLAMAIGGHWSWEGRQKAVSGCCETLSLFQCAFHCGVVHIEFHKVHTSLALV